MENLKLLVSSTPHIRSNDSIENIMGDVLIALAPASIMGIFFFGWKALLIIIISMASCAFFEAAYQKLTKQPVTVTDLSALVTGLLLALNLPVTSPFWLPIVGGFFAIVVAKQVFGGLGQNFINPALAARAFLVASYPTLTTGTAFQIGDSLPIGIDGITSATPLAQIAESETALNIAKSDFINAVIGRIGGTIGETCAVALILGGVYLIARKVISWKVPVTYILTVLVLTAIFKYTGIAPNRMPVYEIFTGGLMLGAFFMATDYASSPVTPLGQIIMGVGCGLITTLIRVFGGYPEGVSYSILLMNLCVPLIDRYTKPKIFGEVKKGE